MQNCSNTESRDIFYKHCLSIIYLCVSEKYGSLKSSNETRANLREMKDKMHFFSSFALPCAHELPSLALQSYSSLNHLYCKLCAQFYVFISFKLDFLSLYLIRYVCWDKKFANKLITFGKEKTHLVQKIFKII